MKFAIIGAGGLGGFFGARLADAGHDVSFLARGEHLTALRERGLTLLAPDGTATARPVHATADPAELDPADAVLLAVKIAQLDAAVAALPPWADAVITLQNGVDAPAQVARTVGKDAVLPGVAKVIAALAGPGTVRHVGGPGSLDFAEWDNRPSERAERIRAAFGTAGIPTTPPADIWTELWAKFLFIAPLGGLGAVAGVPFGELREHPETRRTLQAAMVEVERLARASGVELPADVVARTMAFVDRQPADGTTSMQRDIAAGRPSELDAWTGSVVRLGREAGIPTPVNDVLYAVLRLREGR
ncbi:2-dehydropantoate 2-reductase [Amycolatopsis rifamycinica]|uniref:2-dehydropantoate 2-reductase n=1 Tax=Amycolatopsis rifamycinica TaxID=287986 RepID=A0A066U6X9_9PSEU|nr:2-dehydropantoate 2-reductase [Amycolatopsis rifamycinica]KDN19879.1 2-dehydropantoate 2-reductase [Amycolatopsis rifamycinica]